MAIKKEELISGCFAKAADDEPLFVLRATDMLAPDLVRQWADQFGTYHAQLQPQYQTPGWHKKRHEALALADAMEAWPHRKMPD